MLEKDKCDDTFLCVKYKEFPINAKLIYRNRKNITIQIKPIDNIVLISPKGVSKKILKGILLEKGQWIIDKLEGDKQLKNIYREKEYISGEELLYLGKIYYLHVIKDSSIDIRKIISRIEVKGNKIILKCNSLDCEDIKNELKKWYKKESEKIVTERVIRCKEKSTIMMKLTPNSLKIKKQKKRWGSCTSKGDIYINSRISMATLDAIDYIIVHEFSHLIHMNHSKEFYDLVKNIMPSYKKSEDWLRENN
ncbi:MAG: SprT family zinc-dependent metalloprotease [Romboutsia sp.]